jgi:hypothetical protein
MTRLWRTSGISANKMDYPFPDLLALLHGSATVEEYRLATSAFPGSWHIPVYNARLADYWKLIPAYVYARCPFCSGAYSAPIDTYSLESWVTGNDLHTSAFVGNDYQLPGNCTHFMGVHMFINPHNHLPTELPFFPNPNGDLPFLTPWFFAADIETRSVRHALPICRIDRDQFIPTYTACFLTYFSQDQQEIRRRWNAASKAAPDDWPSWVQPPGGRDAYYDLADWAVRGLPGWLDFSTAEVPLRFIPEAQLPALYRAMTGRKRPYSWENGKLILPFG